MAFDFGPDRLKLNGVSATNYKVRRATLEDVTALMAMWDSMHYPSAELARRVTEFQVAEAADGKLLGTLGVQIAERQGLIHSEAFSDFALAELLRPLLWDRVHSIASNHGLLRLWTQENAPFWNHCGLMAADAEALAKMPMLWRGIPGKWLTLKLKEDVETVLNVDKEFALFMESEKQRTQDVFKQARTLKTLVTILAVILLLAVLGWGIRTILHHPQLLNR